MITNEEIKNWRENWQTKTGKLLSIHIDDLLNLNDIIKEAIKRAYAPSVQNTAVKQGKYGHKKLQVPRKLCKEQLFLEFRKLYDNQKVSEEIFEKWEKSTADKIREIYKNNGIDLYTYGNAQKWINMTIKYIFSSNYMNHNVDIYEVAYLPIDSIIQQIAYKELGVKKLSCAWSKCDDWEEIERYQNDIQKAILTNTKYKSRLWWECNAWKA